MRFYAFCNRYLSGIDAGIQSSHSLHELFVKYQVPNNATRAARDTLYDWARNHKTTIVLNGGMQENLQDLYDFLCLPENPYPFAKFHEAEFSLNGALTNVGIILPEDMYKGASMLRTLATSDVEYSTLQSLVTPWQFDLMHRMNKCKLMN